MDQPTNSAKNKEPYQSGQDLVSAIADVLMHHKEFINAVHAAKPLFFRATVTDTRTITGGIIQVQVKRTGQLAADAQWYPVYDAGYYTPAAGDDVLLVYVDRKMSVCVIGARTVGKSLGTREPLVDRLGRALTDNTMGIIYANTL